jgi:5-methylcytosine-specific restriction endonuclease McrA
MTITRTWTIKGKSSTNEVSLRFNLETNEIIWIDCTCKDFELRRIKRYSDGPDTKYTAEPCKHLKPLIDFYVREHQFKLREPKKMKGTDKVTNELRRELMFRSNGICELCAMNEGTQIHRQIRGNNGGKYNPWNCVLLCSKCHKMVHNSEFTKRFEIGATK